MSSLQHLIICSMSFRELVANGACWRRPCTHNRCILIPAGKTEMTPVIHFGALHCVSDDGHKVPTISCQFVLARVLWGSVVLLNSVTESSLAENCNTVHRN
jgi:hypothetical protein